MRSATSLSESWQKSRMQHLQRLGKNSYPVFGVYGLKFMKNATTSYDIIEMFVGCL